ncbi:MAG: AraC family transcriptional regulator, partial [Bdellovibrionales bacterium]|nr:AraC family transcriptional regulator [Bdellovibrionales bacterium]
MLKWAFFVIFATILGIGVYLYFYLGGYKEVAIQETQYAHLNLVYREHNGPYHQIGPVIEMVEKWAKRVGHKCDRTFGEYLDDPAKVEEGRLRSFGGCVVDQEITE